MKYITLLVKDDVTNLIHLYKKLFNTSYDSVALYTAYDRKLKQFCIDSELIKHFPKLTYIGPTAVYEDYVTFANFPTYTDLEDYQNNFINVNIMEHLKTTHIQNIFPKQETIYKFPLNINKTEFDNIVLNPDNFNICINIFDMMYDKSFALHYNLIYCLSELNEHFKNIEIHLIGLHNEGLNDMVLTNASEIADTVSIKLTNHLNDSFSSQMGVLLKSKKLISNPFGFGALAYTTGVNSLIIYPFYDEHYIGKTIDPTKNNKHYIESTEEDYIDNLELFIENIKE